MMYGLTSKKLFEYEPFVACKTLVLPPAVAHVTSTSAPCVTMEVIRKLDAPFVGSMPARNSQRLLQPSPSGSAAGSAAGLLVLPKYWICQACIAVSTVIRLLDTMEQIPAE